MKKQGIKNPCGNTSADQDADFFYVSNEPNLVECARRAYRDYPTVVNSIPQSSKSYDNTPESQAAVDSAIAASRINIGSSSNVSQICQSYDCTIKNIKYADYCCILAVLAQISIDSAKKGAAINVTDEITYIKQDIDIAGNGYPIFWKNIQPEKRDKINLSLTSPMCTLSRLRMPKVHYESPTLPMEKYFVNYDVPPGWRVSKRVERLIEEYSFKEYLFHTAGEDDEADFLLLRDDFEKLVTDIRRCCLPEKYIGLVSWLLNRAFVVTSGVKRQEYKLTAKTAKNKATLLSVLYEVSPQAVLKCFAGNLKTDAKTAELSA